MINKKTKIVATVGPASDTKEMLYKLAQAGVDVYRLNFSHGSHAEHLERINNIRANNEEFGISNAILQDLQGPKIRIGNVESKDGVLIVPGQTLVFTNQQIIGTSERVSTPYDGMYNDVSIGHQLLLDDGKMAVEVTAIEGSDVITKVIYGGMLKSKKGVNLPKTRVSMPSVTDKDYADLEFGLANNVEWVALSFIREAADIQKVKDFIKARGGTARVIAKIEMPEAVDNIDAIIAVTDGIMVARGDLGVEMLAEEVPMIQKMIVEKCNRVGKPVIVATQMLESMIDSPRPTRAEINDIANSVLDGADAVMLSAETAAGSYPIESVMAMSKTIAQVEKIEAAKHPDDTKIYYRHHADVNNTPSNDILNDNVVMSACRLARDTNANAIIGVTTSGYTGFRLSHHRPTADLYVFTPNRSMMNTLALYWGVKAVYYDRKHQATDDLVEDIKNELVQSGKLKMGDIFVNTLSMPSHAHKRTNSIKLSTVE
jgi:pyruvate kinase